MKHLLSSTAFLIVNKELAKQVGLKAAVLLADLISKEEYFISKGMTDGWFFNTEANIEADTTLNPYHQRKCIKTLKTHQIIETKRMGIPAKQYFKINEQQVMQILNNLLVKNSTTINKNKEIRIINNTISNRKNDFVFEVLTFNYDESILNGFIDYWTEPNKSNTKMKFELNKTWKTELRLKTWATNQKKWDKPKNNNTTSHRHQKGQDYGDGSF
mgnify:CR=1 FL=1